MERSVALALAAMICCVTAAAAEVRGSWVKSKSECQYRSGERNEVSISGRTISSLEFACSVTSRTRRNGYTVDTAECGGEGFTSTETIRYKLDKSGALHIRIGKQAEEIYRYTCR